MNGTVNFVFPRVRESNLDVPSRFLQSVIVKIAVGIHNLDVVGYVVLVGEGDTVTRLDRQRLHIKSSVGLSYNAVSSVRAQAGEAEQ